MDKRKGPQTNISCTGCVFLNCKKIMNGADDWKWNFSCDNRSIAAGNIIDEYERTPEWCSFLNKTPTPSAREAAYTQLLSVVDEIIQGRRMNLNGDHIFNSEAVSRLYAAYREVIDRAALDVAQGGVE